jgi:hypothetical protein
MPDQVRHDDIEAKGYFSKLLLDIPEVSELPNTNLSKLIEMPFTYGKPLIVSSFLDDDITA